jgi:hypothetical protein
VFISELINDSFYYVAEKPSATDSPPHLLRWSLVPHKPEPILRVHFTQVPHHIREQCYSLFRDDTRRRSREEKNSEIVVCIHFDACHDRDSVSSADRNPRQPRPHQHHDHNRLERPTNVSRWVRPHDWHSNT